MEEAQDVEVHVTDHQASKVANSSHSHSRDIINKPSKSRRFPKYKWWIRLTIYTIFILAGQSVATLLGRLYYDKGGNSKWLATLVHLAGFPILLPCLFISLPKSSTKDTTNNIPIGKPSVLSRLAVYLSLGLLLSADSFLYSLGLLYLPVSTYSLICASQLAFNALFSFLLNSQKFTAPIVNSLVLITISSALLVFQPNSENPNGQSKKNYVIGFLTTIGASAGYALMLSLTQLAYHKVLKKETFRAVLEMIIYQSLVATLVTILGLLASGEWKDLGAEMGSFALGKVSYLMTLIWTAICWQVFSIGSVGLIFEVSSLFSNVISTVGLPVVPVFAVIFFRDEMDGVKVVAMVLAIWGFVSYIYHHYVEDFKSRKESTVCLGPEGFESLV